MDNIIEQLNNSKKPIFVEKILPAKENKNILNILSLQRTWYFGRESNGKPNSIFDLAYSNEFPHLGMTCRTADEGHKDFFDHPLNMYASIIANILSDAINLEYSLINRVYWNYYFKGQSGIGHIDNELEKSISIIYNPMSTDGGTEILSEFYPDIEGQAKIFKSSWLHKGVTTKKDKARSNLNIVLT